MNLNNLPEIGGGIGMRKYSFLFLGLVLLLASSLFAAGVSLTGIGARATSLSGAYRGISDDWSGMFWNPAGLTQISGLHVGASTELLWPVASYLAGQWNGMNFSTLRTVETENEPRTFIIPAAGVVYNLNEQLTVGLGFWAPFGLGAKWDLLDTKNYNANYPEFDYEDDLQVIDFHPTIAYKLSDKISIGAGLSIVYADIMIRKPSFIQNPYFGEEIYAAAGAAGPVLKGGFQQVGALAPHFNHVIVESELTGNGLGFGGNLGLMFKLTEDLQLGISGRYYMDVKLDGTVNGAFYFGNNPQANGLIQQNLKPTLDGMKALKAITDRQHLVLSNAYSGAKVPVYTDASADADLPLPMDVGIGLAYKAINEEDTHLLFSADFMWTQWSTWDIIDIKIEGGDVSQLVEKWDDSYRVNLGVEYKLNPMLAFRGSFYHEKNAAVAETLTPTIPDINSRNTVNVGLEFKIMPGLALHASYEKIFIGDMTTKLWHYDPVENEYHNMAGEYKMSVNNLMFGLGYNF